MEIRRYDKKLMRSGFSVSRKKKIFPQCVLLLLYKLISSRPTLVLLVPKVQLSDDCETLCNICMAFFGLFWLLFISIFVPSEKAFFKKCCYVILPVTLGQTAANIWTMYFKKWRLSIKISWFTRYLYLNKFTNSIIGLLGCIYLQFPLINPTLIPA